MKKLILLLASFAFSRVFADDFTDILQDLTIQTACIGQYSATQAGGGWTDDPNDYYTPKLMAERFAKMSGNQTKTQTFYGICFDYAEAAWNDINKFQKDYVDAGMKEGQFWLAGTHENPNEITLSNPTDEENATGIQNGVFVQTYETSKRDVKTHKNQKGERVTHHAWLWVERADGVWFWFDPTWTDNLGYVVWGCVTNDEEIQCKPDKRFCIEYPDYLEDLPNPPALGKIQPTKSSKKSTNSVSSSKSSSPISIEENNEEIATLDKYKAYGITFSIPLSLISEGFSFNNFGLSVDCVRFWGPVCLTYSAEFLHGEDSANGLLLSGGGGWRVFDGFGFYAGFGLGIKNKDGLFKSENYGLAYKIETGAIAKLSSIFFKFEFSYNNVSNKFCSGIGIGILSKNFNLP